MNEDDCHAGPYEIIRAYANQHYTDGIVSEFLCAPEANVRAFALRALAECDKETALQCAQDMLEDDDSEVRAAAAEIVKGSGVSREPYGGWIAPNNPFAELEAQEAREKAAPKEPGLDERAAMALAQAVAKNPREMPSNAPFILRESLIKGQRGVRIKALDAMLARAPLANNEELSSYISSVNALLDACSANPDRIAVLALAKLEKVRDELSSIPEKKPPFRPINLSPGDAAKNRAKN